MILSELRSYLKEKKRVTLHELVIHFDIDADALRGMLSKWISKGKVRQLPVGSGCGTTCCKCDPTLTEFYEWKEESAQDVRLSTQGGNTTSLIQ